MKYYLTYDLDDREPRLEWLYMKDDNGNLFYYSNSKFQISFFNSIQEAVAPDKFLYPNLFYKKITKEEADRFIIAQELIR